MSREYYNYIPIYKEDEIPELKNIGTDLEKSLSRHRLREKDALTELIAQITDVCESDEIKALFAKLKVKLIEDSETGSRTITASFTNKRFY